HFAACGRVRRLFSTDYNTPRTLFALCVQHRGKLCFNEATEEPGDYGDVLVAHLLAFGAQALSHLPPKETCIDELHLALAMCWLAVGDYPDIGGDARVVEHIGRQADDGFEQIVLKYVAAYFTLTAARTSCEQRRAIEHDAEPTAAILRRSHL